VTWTRLERSALGYVIAGLARYGWASTEVGDLPPEAEAAVLAAHSRVGHHVPARLRMARLSLYLRLLRRVGAWEERPLQDWPDWTCPRYQAPIGDGTWVTGDRVQYDTWTGGYMEDCRLAPWRPLWLNAPPYDPAVTPRMRREASRRPSGAPVQMGS